MADVFISYARADAVVAGRVAKALQSAGYSVWWDADLPAHRAYSEEIERNLANAKAVVVLWSKDAAASQWVRAEADVARNGAKLIQGKLDATMPPLPFNQIQCADLKGWRGGGSHAGFARLQASVEALVSGKEPQARPALEPTLADRLWPYRWFAAAAFALLVAATAFLLLRSPTYSSKPVLAVLPFTSLDGRDESLVAGMWEDTRAALSRNPQLLVLGPNTSEELGEKPETARRAADFLVEASVRAVGDRVRVSANLTRTKDGSQLWSESFDRRLDDVFQLQSEIAREIEGRIRGRLATGGGIQPHNIATTGEVYALYNDARAKIRKRDPQQYEAALKQLQLVVQRDPNFAPGWATFAVVKQIGGQAAEVDGTSAEANARRAISLAPNLAAGHAALGLVLQRGPAAQASLRRALELDPNDIEALNWMANSLDDSERQEKLKLYSRIAELEPLWWPAIFNKLDVLARSGNPDAIGQELARVERLGDPRLIAVVKVELYKQRGDLSAAVNTGLDFFRKAKPEERRFIGQFIWAPLVQTGHFPIADQLVPVPPMDFIPFLRAGDVRALDMVEAQVPPREFWRRSPLPIIASRIYLYHHQEARLVRRYRAVSSSADGFENAITAGDLAPLAPFVAMALANQGDQGEADRLLARAAAEVEARRDSPEDQMWLARIRAVQGQKDEALRLLTSAVRRGWRPTFVPIHLDLARDPPLALLATDRRFEAIREQIRGHFAKERAELGAISLN